MAPPPILKPTASARGYAGRRVDSRAVPKSTVVLFFISLSVCIIPRRVWSVCWPHHRRQFPVDFSPSRSLNSFPARVASYFVCFFSGEHFRLVCVCGVHVECAQLNCENIFSKRKSKQQWPTALTVTTHLIFPKSNSSSR